MGKPISKSYKIGLIERQSITTHRNIRNTKTLNKCICSRADTSLDE